MARQDSLSLICFFEAQSSTTEWRCYCFEMKKSMNKKLTVSFVLLISYDQGETLD